MIEFGDFGPIIAGGFGIVTTIVGAVLKRRQDRVVNRVHEHDGELDHVNGTMRIFVHYAQSLEKELAECVTERHEGRELRSRVYEILNLEVPVEGVPSPSEAALRKRILTVLERRVATKTDEPHK